MSIGKDNNDEDVFHYDNLTLKNSNEEEILGVTIDRKLTFHQHNKKSVVKQVKNWVPYWDSLLTMIPIKGIQYTLPWSNLNWITFPLRWMFCPIRSSNLTNKVQEKALRIRYNDQLTNLKSLLSNHNEITIHQRNLHVLMTEIQKQPSRGVLSKRCSENMAWVFSCKFAVYFQNTFYQEHLWTAASGI